jgi:nicotinamide-nucleotide amidase
MNDSQLYALAETVGEALSRRRMRLVTAESCTGGWVAESITDVPGCSDWFDCGFVTYSNHAKQELLGVPSESLLRHGAVSEEVVRAMAVGALSRTKGDFAVAISGIAGPGGGTVDKPVGLVWIAWCCPAAGVECTRRELLPGDRSTVRRSAVARALRGIVDSLEG